MVKEAYSTTISYFEDLQGRVKTDRSSSNSFLAYACPSDPTSTYLSSEELAAMRTTFEADLAAAIADLNAETKVFDASYWKKKQELVDKMEAEYAESVRIAKYEAMYPPPPFLNKELDEKWISTFLDSLATCYDITLEADGLSVTQ